MPFLTVDENWGSKRPDYGSATDVNHPSYTADMFKSYVQTIVELKYTSMVPL